MFNIRAFKRISNQLEILASYYEVNLNDLHQFTLLEKVECFLSVLIIRAETSERMKAVRNHTEVVRPMTLGRPLPMVKADFK